MTLFKIPQSGGHVGPGGSADLDRVAEFDQGGLRGGDQVLRIFVGPALQDVPNGIAGMWRLTWFGRDAEIGGPGGRLRRGDERGGSG